MLSTNSTGKTGDLHLKTKGDIGIHKNYSNQFINFSVKCKTIKLSGDNTEKNLVHFGFHNEFLDAAPKAPIHEGKICK